MSESPPVPDRGRSATRIIEIASSAGLDLAIDFFVDSRALAVALIDDHDEILFLNHGMRVLLVPEGGTGKPDLARCVSPTLSQLRRQLAVGDGVVEGVFTFGDMATVYRSLRGSARRHEGNLLLLLEYDVEELERLNHEVAEANSEVVNLQRELSREKRELARALDELKHTQGLLVHSEKMNAIGQMTAGVAHEINNPVAFVASNTHSLKRMLGDLIGAYQQLESAIEGSGSQELRALANKLRQDADLDFLFEDVDDLLESCLSGLGRVKQIVADLRIFSRLDEAEYKIADVRAGLESTLTLAGPAVRKAAVELEVDLQEGVPATWCSPGELNQAFLNILMNGIQATAKRVSDGPGRVRVRLTADEHMIRVELADNGCGMPAEVRQKIFDPFFTTKEVGEGTGLGLSLVHSTVVERHGGTIDVDSTPGEGTTFVITIPIRAEGSDER